MPGLLRASQIGPAFAEILEKGRLRFAISLDNRPYGFRNASGDPEGIDVAIARLIARGLQVEPVMSEVPTARRLDVLLAGEVHVAINISITAGRARRVLFTTPYIQGDVGLGAPASLALRRPADMAGLRFAANAASESEVLAQSFLPAGAHLISYPTPDQACEALLRGEVEGIVAPRATVRDLIARHPDAQIEYKFTFAMRWRSAAVNFGEHDLLRTLNTVFFQAREEGLLTAIHEHFTGQPSGPLPAF